MARDGFITVWLWLRCPPHGEGELRLVAPARREEEVVPGGVREQLSHEQAGVDLDLAALGADLPGHGVHGPAAEAGDRDGAGGHVVDRDRGRADDVAWRGHGRNRETLVAALEKLDVEHRRGAAGQGPEALGA